MAQGGNAAMKMYIVKQHATIRASGEVMDGHDARGLLPGPKAVIGRGEPGLPVIAMHQIGLPGGVVGVAAQPGSDMKY